MDGTGLTMAEAVFWLSLLLLAYTFAGYPLLVAAWARLRPRPLRPLPAWTPRVAIVVVMHDEAPRVEAKLRSCLAQDYPAARLRVLVACDGCADDTARRVGGFSDPRVTLLEFARRRGKAACLNDAVASCDEEVIVFTDARQALDPAAVRWLVHGLSDPAVAAVSGELVFRGDGVQGFGQGVDAYWRYEKFIRRAEAAVHSVPGVTGALYALRRDAWRPIPPQVVLDDVIVPMQACIAGRRVVFEARALAFDEPARDAATERRRKVRTLAGNFQLLTLMPELLAPWRNPIALQFVSHKVLRLLAPWAMLALLAANAVLAAGSPGYALALGLQVLLYALPLLALAGPRLREWRVVRVAQAFVALNGFAVLGLLEFLTNRRVHLWRTAASSGGEGRA
jgi:cellulose synthase/poly-beta-1,6-N-acetylglucosamine synthase-like glycosyltransferase